MARRSPTRSSSMMHPRHFTLPSTRRETSADQILEDLTAILHGCLLSGVESDLCSEGWLVRVVDAGETLQLASPREGIQPLAVPLLANFDRRVDEHLYEAVLAHH